MKVSCGFIIEVSGKWLMCHPTNGPYTRWDFPKGMAEPHESNLDAAVRELREETGYELAAQYYTFAHDLGEAKYTKIKSINLFYVRVNEQINIRDLYCDSIVTDIPGVQPFPEVDKFIFVTPAQSFKLMGKSMKEYALTRPFLVDLIRKSEDDQV